DCVDEELLECPDGHVCPITQACYGAICVRPELLDDCAGQPEGTPCDVTSFDRGICRAALCVLPACGDGFVDPNEACDDGNSVDGDGCTRDCTSTGVCGNGIRDEGEQCDDGADGVLVDG